MAPKKKVDLPAVPPEANPEDTLPKEIKDLKEPPFTVQWQAVNSVMCLDPAIKADKLRETLSRKKLVRTPALFDLVLRLSPESELSTAIRVDLDEHLGAQLPVETFIPKTEHAVEVLKQRFERDRRIDWKLELHARQRALASSEEEVKVSEAAVETAQAELAASEEALKVWEEEQEAARIASLDNEEDGGDDDVGDEPSEAQEAQEAALNSVEQCKLALVEAKEKLAAASSSQLEPFVKYQAYWIDGLGTESEAILSAVSQGLDLTSVVWAWPLPPSPPQAPEMWDVSEEGAVEGTGDVAKEEPSAEAEPAAEVSEPQPEPVYEPPPMYLAIKETVKNPDWNSPLALVVPLDVRLPPSVVEVEPVVEDKKGKKGAKSGTPSTPKEGKSKGKGKVEETPPQTPPLLDAPGWDILAQLFASISQHARAYREWRAKVVVHGTPKEAADAGPAPMDVYEALVQGVPQEQLSVPVLMHAMLEQVATNLQGEESSVLNMTAAQNWLLDALDLSLRHLDVGEGGESILHDNRLDDQGLSLIHTGDQVTAAAAGLTVGRVRPPPMGVPAGQSMSRPASPISTLEGYDAMATPGGEGSEGRGNSEIAEGEADVDVEISGFWTRPKAKPGPLETALLPATALLDVGAVEAHMRALFHIPGVKRRCMPEEPELDEVTRELQLTNLKSQTKTFEGLTSGSVERHRLMQAFVNTLPARVQVSHQEEVMQRSYIEQFSTEILRQVVLSAQLEFPHHTCGYYPREDCMLLAMFAGDDKRTDGLGLPVTLPFSSYWEHVTSTADGEEEVLEMPDTIYNVPPEIKNSIMTGAESRYQFVDEGVVLSTGAAGPLTIHKGPMTLSYSVMKVEGEEEEEQVALPAGPPTGGTPDGGANQAEAATPPPSANTQRLNRMKETGCSQLTLQLEGGITVSAAKLVIENEKLVMEYPSEEQVAAARAHADAAVASAAVAAEHLAALQAEGGSKPGSAKGSKPGTAKKGAKKNPAEMATLQAAELSAMAAAESAALAQAAAQAMAEEAALAPAMPPPALPVYAIRVSCPDGTSYELTTQGYLTMTQPPSSAPGAPPARAVKVPGAPLDAADLSSMMLKPVVSRAFTSDGSLISRYRDGDMRVVHADGSVSQRIKVLEGWTAMTGAPAGGWKRTFPDGSTVVEPDPGAGVTEGLEPRPRQAGGAPVPLVHLTDPDSGARVAVREDLVMMVQFPGGEMLLQDVDGSRICSQPSRSSAWSGECAGLPPVVYSGKDLSFSPMQGIALSWNVAHKAVSCQLPDGSSIVLMRNVALWIPTGLSAELNADLVAYTAQSLAANEMDGDVVAMAQAPPCRGAAVFDLLSGAAALFCPESGQGHGPARFVIAPGGREMVEWVDPPNTEKDAVRSAVSSDPGSRRVSMARSAFHKSMSLIEAELAPALPPRLFVTHPSGEGYEILSNLAVSGFFAMAKKMPGAVRTMEPLHGSDDPDVVVHSMLAHLPQHSAKLSELPLGNVVLEQKRNPIAAEMNGRPSTARQAAAQESKLLLPFSNNIHLPRMIGFEPPALPSAPIPPVLYHRMIIEYPSLNLSQKKAMGEALEAINYFDDQLTAQQSKQESLKDYRPTAEIAGDADVLEAILAMRKTRGGKATLKKPEEKKRGGEGRRKSTVNEVEGYLSKAAPSGSGHYKFTHRASNTGSDISSDISVSASKEKDHRPTDHATKGHEAKKDMAMTEVEMLPDLGSSDEEQGSHASRAANSDQYIQFGSQPTTSRLLPPRLPPTYGETNSRPQQKYGGAPGSPVPAPASGTPGMPSQVEILVVPNLQQRQGDHQRDRPPLRQPSPLRTVSPPMPPTSQEGPPMYPTQHSFRPPSNNGDMPHGSSRPAPAPLMSWAPRPAGPKFTLSPDHLHFGTVALGGVAHSAVRLRNGSRSAASYSVVRPELPLRMIQKPGGLAPGAEAFVTVEFVAEKLGNFVGEITINTDSLPLKLTVSAKVVE